MNRKKVNGPPAKGNERTFKTECESNNSSSTDSFDMNDFKSSSLTKKYSVQIHKNNADLMAELNSINIMGDESDVEIIEPKIQRQNGLSVSANNSKGTCMNTTRSSDDRQNSEFQYEKHERILAWAQSQSQNLSMCVASVLSDHDYLSQELLLGIIAGIEENTEMENQRESNGNNTKEQNDDLENEMSNIGPNGTTTTSTMDQSNEKLNLLNIDELNAILKQLTSSKERAQSLSLLEKIEEKTKELKTQLNDDVKTNINSTDTCPEFSPDHSEPLEYYGGIKFSTQSSIDDTKESDGNEKCNDVVVELRSELKAVDDIANRVSIDATSIRTKLKNIENQSEDERTQAIGKLRENLALLVEDMANELTKMAVKLNPSKATSIQKVRDGKSKSRSVSDSTDADSGKSESRRKSRKLKRRRKIPKSQAGLSESTTDLSSNSEDMVDRGTRIVKDEPYVVSQSIDDLMNGNASNSANESIRKENDFLGFDNDDDDGEFEIGIKTELNDTFPSQVPTSEKDVSNAGSKNNDNDSGKSTELVNPDKHLEDDVEKSQSTENSAIENMEVDADHSPSVASLSEEGDGDEDEDNDLIDDDDDDDEDIRKYAKTKIHLFQFHLIFNLISCFPDFWIFLRLEANESHQLHKLSS